jgi:hypothetical protein
MTQRHIIYVPGKNPKPPAAHHRALLWSALLEGVRRVLPKLSLELAEQTDYFKLIAWNYLYYESQDDGSDQTPWVEAVIEKQEPDDEDIREANAWNHKLDKLLYSAIDQLPSLIQILPRSARATAEELERYFKNEKQIASLIREQLKQELRPMLEKDHNVLLIGHSLGSVIAYDTLWALSNLEHLPGKIDLFLTIGSPLGMNYVQQRLLGKHHEDEHKYPGNIQKWVNISAVGDLIALDRSFSDDYKKMLDLGLIESITDQASGIYNYFRNEEGLNCHRSYGYLSNAEVGKVIADWWQGSCVSATTKPPADS